MLVTALCPGRSHSTFGNSCQRTEIKNRTGSISRRSACDRLAECRSGRSARSARGWRGRAQLQQPAARRPPAAAVAALDGLSDGNCQTDGEKRLDARAINSWSCQTAFLIGTQRTLHSWLVGQWSQTTHSVAVSSLRRREELISDASAMTSQSDDRLCRSSKQDRTELGS